MVFVDRRLDVPGGIDPVLLREVALRKPLEFRVGMRVRQNLLHETGRRRRTRVLQALERSRRGWNLIVVELDRSCDAHPCCANEKEKHGETGPSVVPHGSS